MIVSNIAKAKESESVYRIQARIDGELMVIPTKAYSIMTARVKVANKYGISISRVLKDCEI